MRAITIMTLAATALAATTSAQQTGSSARAIGMGGSYTAMAEGFEAVNWNPAMLAAPQRPGFSLNLIQIDIGVGNNAFSMNDFMQYDGRFLDDADKSEILDLVTRDDPDRNLEFDALTEVTGISLSVGNFGASLSGVGATGGSLSSDYVELLLFGNVTRTGPNESYNGLGTAGRAWGTGELAVSYALALPVPVGDLSVGATGRYMAGVGIARIEDLGTSIRNNPNFSAEGGVHALASDVDNGVLNGDGFGIDLGGMYQLQSGLRLGLVLENVLNTMNWDESSLLYYRQEFIVSQELDNLVDSTVADIDGVPFDPTDPDQLALLDAMLVDSDLPIRARVGAAVDLGIAEIAGDLQLNLKNGLELGNKERASVGAELQVIPFLPLRAGLATDFNGGIWLSGGIGLKLGPVRIDLGGGANSRGDRRGFQVATGISIKN